MSQKIIFPSASDMPPTAISQGDMAFNKTGSWRYLRPLYVEKLAPCRQTCPAGTDLPRVISLITEEKFLEAYSLKGLAIFCLLKGLFIACSIAR